MTQRFFYILAFLIAFVGFQSCEDGISLTLPVDPPAVEITIPPIDTFGDFTIGPIPIDVNLDSIATANDIDKSDITSIRIKSASYTMISPVDANFNLFERLSNHAHTAALPEVRYAYRDSIPDDGLSKLELQVDDVEMKDYLLNNEFQLTLKGRNDVPISSPLKIRLEMTMEAKTKVLAQ